MEEEEIVRLIKEEPEEGIAAAMQAYGARVRSMAERVLGASRQEDVEECVADIFVRVWQGIDTYCPQKAGLAFWILGIARHVAIDRLRRIAGKETWPLPDFKETERLGVTPDFSEEVARRENVRIIREAVHGMKQPDRSIFLLRYFYFLTVKEIADRLGMTDKQVENRLRRGRNRLKTVLTKKGVILE